MNPKNILSGVKDTLYIPLVARIYASKRFPNFFYDKKALSLEKCIPTDNIEKNSTGLKYANKYVKKGDTEAQMYFSIDNPSEFASLTQTRLIDVVGFFEDALKICKTLKWKTKLYMYFADKLNRTLVVHIIFNG